MKIPVLLKGEVTCIKSLLAMPELEMRVLGQQFTILLNPPIMEEGKMAPVPLTDMLLYPLRLKVIFVQDLASLYIF